MVEAFDWVRENVRVGHRSSADISHDHRGVVIDKLRPPNSIQIFVPAIAEPIFIEPP